MTQEDMVRGHGAQYGKNGDNELGMEDTGMRCVEKNRGEGQGPRRAIEPAEKKKKYHIEMECTKVHMSEKWG